MKWLNPDNDDLHYLKREYVPEFINGQISLRHLTQECQNLAGDHAEKLGLGEDFKKANQFLYVVMRYKGFFLKPIENKKYTLVTYPTYPGPLQMYRYFYLLDEEGNVVFYFISLWIMMDSVTRRIKLAKCFKNQITNVLKDLETIQPLNDESLTNFELDEERFVFCKDHQVSIEEIDSNQHMNNTFYFGISQDVLGGREFSSVEIDFEKECFLNEIIKLYTYEDDDYIFVIGKKVDMTLSFKIRFKKS